jgi:deoxyribodipyrimidine photo-lyase
MTNIWWIRRDLRLTDNPTLHAALETGSVIPIFILDPAFAKQSTRRKNFLYESLQELDKDLKKRNSYLVIRKGKPVEELKKLLEETKSKAIFAEEDFTPYARKRDEFIKNVLPLKLIHGQTVHHPSYVLKGDGKPYTVYTPYSKIWKTQYKPINLIPTPEKINTQSGIKSEVLPHLESNKHFPAGELEAQTRLEEFLYEKIYYYANDRNRMDLDGTSSLSPYLRFGMIGLRQCVSAVKQAEGQARSVEAKRNAEIWLNELIWREFYIQILYHFPYVAKDSFNPTLKNIAWRNNQNEFEAWKAGKTGVPIVDAAMRQLKEIGWMHNRARMIVASFLVKDLLIDWRWGEAWFMENLLDGDVAANNGGWQWTAGTGTDAAPYFRIFNPVLQSEKFDPHGNYIRKWVAELSSIDSKKIHTPWEYELEHLVYPKEPIVNREIVKERTLRAYQLSKEKVKI